jgi:methyltransferase OMS1
LTPQSRTPTRKPSPSQDRPKARPNPLKNRTIPIVFGSITLFGLSGYCTYLYITLTRPNPIPIPVFPAQQDVSPCYNTIASTFDASVSSTENLMGITSLRRKLISQAHGDVLEVSIGTGRNLEFYDWNFQGFGGVGKVDNRGYIKKGKIRSFTAVDKSAEMLEIAHEKFGAMFPGILGVRWVVGDAGEKGVIPGPPKSANERSGSLDGKYDTVVQTMGLCSVGNPVGLLRTLGECVKEEEGKILLLEHGRGKWDWLNGLLDKSAEGHAKEFGCWWNRDMATIVKESGLEVVKMQTPKWWHGGTTWWIELKKPKSEIDGKTATKHASQVEESKN